ncbi:MAG: hypothetical protein MJ002_01300 [Paludibacteraceae bacterium]|nr:hypothetical protein [Paludibacteraceae bacterium]
MVNFQATYNVSFENLFYPSLVLGLSHFVPDDSVINEKTSFFTVKATAPCHNAVMTLVIDSTPLNYTTQVQQVLEQRNHRYTLHPIVKWKYDDLYRIRRQGVVDLTIHCIIDDEEVDVKNIRINYRSANECLLSLKDTAGEIHDFRWMFTAYVNEEHPYIDSVISSMLDQGVTRRIVGYQSGKDEVVKQVEAIWHYALNRGMTYASISTTSSPAKRANVQHIRFFEEVYKLRQANCVDACVFFASVMRKIGLKPIIFVTPNHAYLGYYTDRNKKNLKLLETTMSQWVDLPRLDVVYRETMEANPEAKGLERLPDEEWQHCKRYLKLDECSRWANGSMNIDQLKRCLSHNLFLQASDYQEKDYLANKKLFDDPKNMLYQMLDVEKSRRVVQPIGGM